MARKKACPKRARCSKFCMPNLGTSVTAVLLDKSWQTWSNRDHQHKQRQCPLQNSEFLLSVHVLQADCFFLTGTLSLTLNYCCRKNRTQYRTSHVFFNSYLIKNMVQSLCCISHFCIRQCSWKDIQVLEVSAIVRNMHGNR